MPEAEIRRVVRSPRQLLHAHAPSARTEASDHQRRHTASSIRGVLRTPRNAFFIPLVADVSALQTEHAELQRLEKNADDRLRELGPDELVEFLHGLKDRLLDVAFDKPLTEAEAAYDELNERVLATEP